MSDDANHDLPPNMAVFEEPPFDPEDTSPTGAVRRDATAPITDRVRRSRPWLNWLLSGVAAVITLIAAVRYIQQSNRPAPQPTATTMAVIKAQPTTAPSAQPTVPPVQVSVSGETGIPA